MKKYLYLVIVVAILAISVFLFSVQRPSDDAVDTLIQSATSSDTDLVVATSSIVERTLGTVQVDQTSSTSIGVDRATSKTTQKSFSYLFEEKEESSISSIVGYFAGGAFGWYVPNWLVDNWEMKDFGAEGMIFKAKIQDNIEDFGFIIFDVSTSTELNNAQNLAYTRQYYIPKDEIIINEVLLNKHSGAGIGIQMETETRIYHITAYTGDLRRITDFYYMDGNGKTLVITFEAKSEFFYQFSDKIRNMVEGIGELKSPQG